MKEVTLPAVFGFEVRSPYSFGRLFAIGVLLLLVAGIGTRVNGQAANESGILPYGTYHGGDFDQVSMSNGHLNIRIPIKDYPQRGGRLNLTFIVRYGNQVWNQTKDCAQGTNMCIYQWNSSVAAGVQFGAEQAPPGIAGHCLTACDAFPSGGIFAHSITMPDGAEHPLGNTSGTLYESIDATGIKADIQSETVTFADGTRYVSQGNGNTVMEDTNGNQIFFGSTITDTLGRNIPLSGSGATSDFSGCTGLLPISSASLWIVPGSNGANETFKLCSALVTIYTNHDFTQANCNQPNQCIQTSGQYSLLQSIVQPDGSAWTFDYSQPDSNGVNWGDLVKITFPTGGSISYTWAHVVGCTKLYGPPGSTSGEVLTRTVDANDGSGPHTWTYSGKVTDPLGNDTVHIFTDLNNSCSLYETQTQYYAGSSTNGSPLKTVTTDYSWTGNPNSASRLDPPMNVVPIRYTTTWADGSVRKTELSYDSGFTFLSDIGQTQFNGIYGKQTGVNEFDYGGGNPGALLKSTQTSYLWQSSGSPYLTYNVLNVSSSVAVFDGGGHQVALATNGYDASAPTSSGITVSHDASPVNGNTRGNLTSVGRWLNGSAVSTSSCPVSVNNGSVTATKTYLDTGMVSQSTDACGHTSTFQYASTPYNGAYLTSSCDALNHCTTMTYNLNPGLIGTVSDPNNQSTVHSYDDLGRLTNISYPDGGQTNVYYPDAATVEVKKLMDPTAGTWMDQYTYFDGIIRPKQTRLIDPEGDVYTETTYDPLGRVATVSNPHRTVSAPTDGITRKTYDAFGRVTMVTEPDNNVLQTSYSDPGIVTLTDETGRQRRKTVDALGRLIQLDEPASTTTGSGAWGAVTISGALQSQTLSPPAKATGTVTISGSEICSNTPTLSVNWLCDGDTISVTVNGITDSYAWCGGALFSTTTSSYQTPPTPCDTPTTVASHLANAINADASMPVTATANGAVIYLTAKTGGLVGNSYALSVTVSTSNGDNPPSFTGTPSGSTLSGGTAGNVLWDTGTVTMSIDGYTATAEYGNSQDATPAAIAADLAAQLQAELPASNPPFSASVVPGSATVNISWNNVGTAGNVTLSSSATTTQTATFSLPSFGACSPIMSNPQNCSTTLTGGTNPGTSNLNQPFSTYYTYDLLNNLLSVSQHGLTSDSTQWRPRTFSYDSLSRLTQSNNPEAGQINFTYDADGDLITRTNPRGLTITYGYDVLNRPTSKQYSDGVTPNAVFVYDEVASYTGAAIGRLTTAFTVAGGLSWSTNATSHEVFGYDPMGRLNYEREWTVSNMSGTAWIPTAAYDKVGHLTSLTYPSGRTVNFSYNTAGRAIGSQFASFSGQTMNTPYYTVPQTTSPSTWGYNPDGSLHDGTFGNGVQETYGYNSRLQLNSITASGSSQTWLSKTYNLYDSSHHNNGDIYAISDGLSSGRNQFYGYDMLSRVTSGYQLDGSFNQTFSYDAWGNMQMSGTNNFNPIYDGNNRIQGAGSGCSPTTAYCYDVAGNLLNDGLHQYTYDADNRIASVDSTGANYTYDAAGERVRRDVTGMPSIEYMYFGGQIIAEHNLTLNSWDDYIFLGARRIGKAAINQNVVQTWGTCVAPTSGCRSQFFFRSSGLVGYKIQSGDKLFIAAYNPSTSTIAGPALTYKDANGNITYGDAITNVFDQDGCPMNQDCSSFASRWHLRSMDLTPLAGMTVADDPFVETQYTTSPNTNWVVVYALYVLVGADGTVHPIFTGVPDGGSLSISTWNQPGASSLTWNSYRSNCPTNCMPQTIYYHDDQIGSARLLSSDGGWPMWQGTFTPFGQEVSPQITTNHYKFTGKERGSAAEGGLDYFGARYYSSTMGRWMTPDRSEAPSPVPYAKLTDPQSLNLYSYVTDDPLSHTDLDGHEEHSIGNQPCPNGQGDDCTTTISTGTSASIYATDHTVEIVVTQTTTVRTVDQDGNGVQTTSMKQTALFYSRDDDKQGTFLGAYSRDLGTASVALTKSENPYETAPQSQLTKDYNYGAKWEKSNMSAGAALRLLGPSGVSGMIDATRPSLIGGMFKSIATHPLELTGRLADAAAATEGPIGAAVGGAHAAADIYKALTKGPKTEDEIF